MTLVKHRCKFCGTAVELELDEDGLKMFTIETWKDMAACNRCADFLEARRGMYRTIKTLHRQWTLTKKKETKQVAANSLEKMLQQWLAKMNVFFRTGIAWDATVMDLLLDEKCNIQTVLLQCERMMRQQTSVAALRVGRASFPIA